MQRFIRRVTDGSRILLIRTVLITAMMILVCLFAAGIAVPLWALATYVPDIFSGFVLVVLIAIPSTYAIFRLRRRIVTARQRGAIWKEFALPVVIAILQISGVVMLLFVAVTFIATDRLFVGIVAAVSSFLLLTFLVTKRKA